MEHLNNAVCCDSLFIKSSVLRKGFVWTQNAEIRGWKTDWRYSWGQISRGSSWRGGQAGRLGCLVAALRVLSEAGSRTERCWHRHIHQERSRWGRTTENNRTVTLWMCIYVWYVLLTDMRRSWLLYVLGTEGVYQWRLVTEEIGVDRRKTSPWCHVILHKSTTYPYFQ